MITNLRNKQGYSHEIGSESSAQLNDNSLR
jgi:hypothetical protein